MNENERLARAAHAALMQRVEEKNQAEPGRYYLPAWEENSPHMHDDFKAVARAVVQEAALGYYIDDVQKRARIFDRIVAWSKKTFPRSTIWSTFEHLRREIDELEKDPANPGEQADIIHLIIQLAQLANNDPMAELEKKFAENQVRAWQEPDEQGVVEHVRPAPSDTSEAEWDIASLLNQIKREEPETHVEYWEFTQYSTGAGHIRITTTSPAHGERSYWWHRLHNRWEKEAS